jgi:hypothetical protein
VIANSHVAAYQPDGTIRQPEALQPTAIVAVPLRTVAERAASEPQAPPKE